MLERGGAARVVYEGVDIGSADAVEMVSGAELASIVLEALDDPAEVEQMSLNAQSLFDTGVLERIGDWVDYLSGKVEQPPVAVGEAIADRRRASGPAERILGLNSNGLDHLLRRVGAGDEPRLTEEERRLVAYKIDGYLASSSHIERARGSRMVGLFRYEKRVEVLAGFAVQTDSKGRYVHSPFVRRDAFVGLGLTGIVSDAVLLALRKGLSDPYFEARRSAASAVVALADRLDPAAAASLTGPLAALAGDRSFEPRAAAIRALGETGLEPLELIPTFRKVYFDPVWKVREALFIALARLVERGLLPARDARSEMNRVLITSNGYNAYYPLKGAYNRLRQAVVNNGTETNRER